jgi:predicted PurR-regulated permease PerM
MEEHLALHAILIPSLIAAFACGGSRLLPVVRRFTAVLVPIAIAASSQGRTMVAWVIAIYIFIQIIEGYVLTPLIQRRTVHIQPAHALGMQMLMGTLFGAIGIALAAPLQAVLRVALMRFSGSKADQV